MGLRCPSGRGLGPAPVERWERLGREVPRGGPQLTLSGELASRDSLQSCPRLGTKTRPATWPGGRIGPEGGSALQRRQAPGRAADGHLSSRPGTTGQRLALSSQAHRHPHHRPPVRGAARCSCSEVQRPPSEGPPGEPPAGRTTVVYMTPPRVFPPRGGASPGRPGARAATQTGMAPAACTRDFNSQPPGSRL